MSDREDGAESANGAGAVGGGWLGTYAYKGKLGRQPPVRFEATLAEPDADGQFTGTVLDDGGLGEADVAGRQSGLGVRFTKVYRQPGPAAVSYEGTLAEDGRTMQGTWQISRGFHGVWDARRAWSNTNGAEADDVEETEEAARDTPRVREVVLLG